MATAAAGVFMLAPGQPLPSYFHLLHVVDAFISLRKPIPLNLASLGNLGKYTTN